MTIGLCAHVLQDVLQQYVEAEMQWICAEMDKMQARKRVSQLEQEHRRSAELVNRLKTEMEQCIQYKIVAVNNAFSETNCRPTKA